MFWLVSRSKSRTVYKPLPLGMGFMTPLNTSKQRTGQSCYEGQSCCDGQNDVLSFYGNTQNGLLELE